PRARAVAPPGRRARSLLAGDAAVGASLRRRRVHAADDDRDAVDELIRGGPRGLSSAGVGFRRPWLPARPTRVDHERALSGPARATRGGDERAVGGGGVGVLLAAGCFGAGCAGTTTGSTAPGAAATAKPFSIAARGDSVPGGTNCSCTPSPPLTATGLSKTTG